jgi:peptidoglycan/LPS O-acetylase OafA/YrhL
MPGLLAVVLLFSLVIGPMISELPLSEYFGSWQVYRYIVLNGGLLGYTGLLPGVFTDNLLTSVNSPLWTLRYEAYCYVLVFGLGMLGLLNRYVTLALYLGGLVFLAFDGPYEIPDFMEWDHGVDLTTKFLAGAVIYHWRPRLNGAAAAACALVSLAALLLGGFWLVLPTFFAYTVIYAALGLPQLPNMARYGDLSYGIYIYGWPVKQLIIHFGLAATWYGVGALATVISIGLGFLSWHLIEKVALSYKDRDLPGEPRVRAWLEQLLGALHVAAPPSPKADK